MLFLLQDIDHALRNVVPNETVTRTFTVPIGSPKGFFVLVVCANSGKVSVTGNLTQISVVGSSTTHWDEMIPPKNWALSAVGNTAPTSTLSSSSPPF